MKNRLRIERQYLDAHPGAAFDESWHHRPGGALVQCAPVAVHDQEARERVLRLEDEIRKLPQFDCPVRHYFAAGVYVREIHIPAGCALVGYIHMQECVTTLSRGTILISDGDVTRELTAPFTMACAAGTKKAGYALTDVVWSDAYHNPDDERDIAKLEERLTADTHREYLQRQSLLTVAK